MNPRLIALVALLLVFVTACDQSDISLGETTPTAAVTVTVALTASEVGAGTLQYWVDHPTELPNPITGTVGVSDPATTFTLTQLPAAPGYTLVMIAYKPNGGDPFCEGNANFDILDGQTTTVNTMLTCPTSDTLPNGEVGVDVTFQLNFCPVIEEILATPQITVVSTPVTIQSLATDPDNTAPVSYLWTASNGAIMDGTQPTTVYTCATVGDHTLTLKVSDGDTRCDQERNVLISCTPNANCGNSIREVTEFCDDGVNDGGDLECLNCTEIQICLDGIVAGTELCDDSGWSATCDTDCTIALCGDGTHNAAAGEVCDDGGESVNCDSDCTAAVCGDGTLNVT
ncbi:MAG: PKD domain-containing protein, partial [Polyangiales bacterium]